MSLSMKVDVYEGFYFGFCRIWFVMIYFNLIELNHYVKDVQLELSEVSDDTSKLKVKTMSINTNAHKYQSRVTRL